MVVLPEEFKNTEWRINHLYKVVNKDGVLVTFKENRMQKEFFADPHPFKILLKSRQLGGSVGKAVRMVDGALFKKNYKTLFLSQTLDLAIDFFNSTIQGLWDNLKIKHLFVLGADNARQLVFRTKGSVSSVTVSNTARGKTLQDVHISEFGKICAKYPATAKEIVSSVIPALPRGAICTIESTAEGELGHFHDMFWEAWDKRDIPNYEYDIKEFKAFFFNFTYDDHELNKIKRFIPIEDMEQSDTFREIAQKHNLDEREMTYYYQAWRSFNKDWNLLRQEYPITPEEAFVSRGNKFFDMGSVQMLTKRFGAIGEAMARYEGNWTIFKDPHPAHEYFVGGDPAGGRDGDNASIQVYDYTTQEQVAEFCSNKVLVDEQAEEAVRMAKLYNEALIIPENNNEAFTELIKMTGYTNIYQEENNEEMIDKKRLRLGFNTNASTKMRMLTKLRTDLLNDKIKIYSKALIRELRVYTRDQLDIMKVEDEYVGHFDRMMAFALALQGETQSRGVPQTKEEVEEIKKKDKEMSWEEKFNMV